MRQTQYSVKLGQIYADRDSRMDGRLVKVVGIDGDKADCWPCDSSGHLSSTARRTRISLSNLEKRFRLVSEDAHDV